ncbi:MAG: metalloprotease family protein [Chloroflexota bacterium]|nr:metalloprotease family protein [Chloroflexota bacterium]
MPPWLVRFFGGLHEALHVLALRLIGRRPIDVGATHVDIPDDLSDGAYIFVTAAPTVVFLALWVTGIIFILSVGSLVLIALGLALALFGGMGAAGGMGDIQLILIRWQARRRRDG